MEEIDIKIKLKKINKNLKSTKKIIVKLKKEQQINKKQISIDKVKIRKVVLSKMIHTELKVYLSTLLEI